MPTMEVEAYPAMRASKKPNAFLKLQSILHSTDSVVLPCSLLLLGSIMVLYQHMNDPHSGRHSVRNCLAKILISMVPLAFFERRILQCKDPVGLFAECSVKVLLMHGFFIGLRLACLAFPGVEVGYACCHAIAFVGACVMLPLVFGLRLSKAAAIEHLDVACLAFGAFLAALLEVSLLGNFSLSDRHQRPMFITDVMVTGSDYIELLAFVPAVWMASPRNDVGALHYKLADSQRRAACLFAFLIAFYSVEDLASGAWECRNDYALVACGYVAHFLLFLDFSAFLLAHLYDPEKFAKLRERFLALISDACAV